MLKIKDSLAIKWNAYDDRARVWVLIPIETKAREYHAKLLLACTAAEAGFGVILGRKGILEFNARFLPRGIMVLNSIASERDRQVKAYRRMGYAMVAWCEEGVAYRNRESYRNERVSPVVMAHVDRFFAWGSYHAADVLMAVGPREGKKIVPSGSPRLDMLGPGMRGFYADGARRIRERYGRIILVNTNFHRFNHFLGRGAYLKDLRERGKIPDGERERFFTRWIGFLEDMYRAFAGMVRTLSTAMPDHTIVLRPHPSEDHGAWQTEFQGLANVRVIHEGSALHWILAADVVVHNSCTTGIEAFAMGVPVVAYRPLTSDAYDSFLPNAVSREAGTEAELVDLLRASVSGTKSDRDDLAEQKHRTAQRFFGGLEGPSASAGIVAELKTLNVRSRPFADNRIHAMARELAVRTILPGRASLRRAVIGPHPQEAYYEQKFPPLPLSELLADVKRLRSVSGRFGDIGAKEIGETLFCITSNG